MQVTLSLFGYGKCRGDGAKDGGLANAESALKAQQFLETQVSCTNNGFFEHIFNEFVYLNLKLLKYKSQKSSGYECFFKSLKSFRSQPLYQLRYQTPKGLQVDTTTIGLYTSGISDHRRCLLDLNSSVLCVYIVGFGSHCPSGTDSSCRLRHVMMSLP